MSSKTSERNEGEESKVSSLLTSEQQKIAIISPRTGLSLCGGIVQGSSKLPEEEANSSAEPEAANNPEKTRIKARSSDSSKLCGVCGDVAKSYHFGGLSCQSCKAFFRRSVQNDMYLQFTCNRGGRNCTMTKYSRKTCQYCRMKRCLRIGMEKRWVMNEDERKAFVKSRAGKKNCDVLATTTTPIHHESSSSSCPSANATEYVPRIDCMIKYMSQEEINEIKSIVEKYVEAYKKFPYRLELHSGDDSRPGFQVMEMLGTVVKRFALYCRMMQDFVSLSNQDQRILLKGGVLEMCLLRGALAFDPVKNCWPNTDMSVYKDSPVLKVEDVTKMVSSAVIEKHIEFIHFVQRLGVDEATNMLLVLVVLFTSRPSLSRPDLVENRQIYYSSLLKRYVDWRFGADHSQNLFNKLLTKLSDLRELSESHNRQTLHFESDELFSIQQQLKELKISPFPEFNVLGEGNGSRGDNQQENFVAQASTSGSQLHHDESPSTSSIQKGEATSTLLTDMAEKMNPLMRKEGNLTTCSSRHENPRLAQPYQYLCHEQKLLSDECQQTSIDRKLFKYTPHQVDYNKLLDSSPSSEGFRSSVSQMTNLGSQMATQFMNAIHHSVDLLLAQPYDQCEALDVKRSPEGEAASPSSSLLFGSSSPPALNPEDYDPSFGLSKDIGFDVNIEGNSFSEDAFVAEDVANTESSHSLERKLLEEICSELVKCSESFEK